MVAGARECVPPLLALLALAGVVSPAWGASAEHGKELFALAAGCGCHTMNVAAGNDFAGETAAGKNTAIGAGGAAIETPFGTFFGSNITPDPDTGIGSWTDEEIDAAIRGGRLRSGEAESPAMPYYWYAGMSDADIQDLIAYLRTLAPVVRASRPHEGELPLARWSYWAWQLMFFDAPPRLAVAPAGGVERGRYLADHVSLCADCHTPRTALGAVDSSMYMAGTADGPGGDPVPNITPDKTGIEGWDVVDVVNLLRIGMLPDFDNVQGAMAKVVDGVGGGPGYKDASGEDRRAIADYLLTVPPIANSVEGE